MLWWLPKSLPTWCHGSSWVIDSTNLPLPMQVLGDWGGVFFWRSYHLMPAGSSILRDLVWLDVLCEYNLWVLPPDWVSIVVCQPTFPPAKWRGGELGTAERQSGEGEHHLSTPCSTGSAAMPLGEGAQTTDRSPAAPICCVLLGDKIRLWWALYDIWQLLSYSGAVSCRYNLKYKQGAGLGCFFVLSCPYIVGWNKWKRILSSHMLSFGTWCILKPASLRCVLSLEKCHFDFLMESDMDFHRCVLQRRRKLTVFSTH